MLAQSHRFHGLSALRPLYKSGRIVRGAAMSLRFQARADENYRAAVVVSKKVHKSAVVRNRIRRRVYECLRTVDQSLLAGQDVALFVYSEDFAHMSHDVLTKEVKKLLLKARTVTDTDHKRAIVEQEGE